MFSILWIDCCNHKLMYILILLLGLLYLFVKYTSGYWQRRNIYSPPTNSWLMGHLGDGLYKIPITLRFAELYNENKKRPLVGVNISFMKNILMNDLDLIKNVLSKDYHYFEGHGFKMNKKYNLLAQHLFNLEGEEWKRIRMKLTPTFTSSKMKYMYDTIYSCNEVMIDHLKEKVKSNKEIEIKEVIAKLGTDVIASCAFGIETNSFKDPNAEFRKMGKKFFDMDLWMMVYDTVAVMIPSITETLPIARIPKDLTKFFKCAIEDTIAYREHNNVKRNDFLQLLIEMKNADPSSASHLTMGEILPQVFVFFVAGFETSSTTVQYALLELAKNPDIRDEITSEIDKAIEENDGKISYDLVYKMHTLDEVVNETLRMYPPVPILTRRCTRNYPVPNTDVVIENGTPIIIPVYGIHHDPDVYPEPEKFIPKRFSAENQKTRHQFAHLPFGEGPRVCIGTRFGMIQTKLAIMIILRNFKVDLSPRTSLPLKYDSKTFLLHTEGEMYLNLTPRNL